MFTNEYLRLKELVGIQLVDSMGGNETQELCDFRAYAHCSKAEFTSSSF
jgi:hypothetical protein